MPTSGTYDFNMEVDDIIQEAYENIGIDVASGYDARTARRSLNLLLTEWANKKVTLWTVERRVIPCVAGQADYELDAKDVDLMEVAVRKGVNDYVIGRVSRNEELFTPTKTQQGRPTQYWFQRRLPPKLTVWPVPDSATMSLVVNVFTYVQDVASYGEEVATPRRFLPAMIAGLSYKLAIKKARDRVGEMKAIYNELLIEAMAEDQETSSFTVRPSAGSRRAP